MKRLDMRKPAALRRNRFLALIFVCLAAITGRGVSQSLEAAVRKAHPAAAVSDARVQQAITKSRDYLIRSCGPGGRFIYKVDEITGQVAPSYNIIRHEGAVYSLAMLYAAYDDPSSLEAITRADGYLRSSYISPGIAPDVLVVWTRPFPDRSAADLGATGLGLVALTSLDRFWSGAIPIEQLRALGHFGLLLQRTDGSFIDKYRTATGPVEEFESLYYPGEMALGFLSLYEVDHSKTWLDAAKKALMYLARRSAGQSAAPPDHWAMIAMAKLFEICGRERIACPAPREELIRYAEQVSQTLLAGQQQAPTSDPRLLGSFGPSGRTAPTATRLEGLLAALEFLPPGPMRAKIKPGIDLGINFLLRAQIADGPYTGGVPKSIVASEPESSEIRIDYVQHALCAWLRYEKLFGLDHQK